MRSTEANKAAARSFFHEADRGRTPVELCGPGFTAHFPGPGQMDLEAFDQFETMIRSAFSDVRHPIEDMVAERDRVAVRLRFEGTHTGEFMGVPASGKHCSVEGTAFLRIGGGTADLAAARPTDEGGTPKRYKLLVWARAASASRNSAWAR